MKWLGYDRSEVGGLFGLFYGRSFSSYGLFVAPFISLALKIKIYSHRPEEINKFEV